MIDPVGLAYPLAPLDEALLRLPPGSLFDAVVQTPLGAGRYRLLVAGAALELETALTFSKGDRVRLAVKSTAPLTLELTRLPGQAARPAEEVAAPGARVLAPDLEAAIRAFVSARPEEPAREFAARFLADRGLGFHARAAAGVASLAARPEGAGALLARAVAALAELGPAAAAPVEVLRAAFPDVAPEAVVELLLRAGGPGAGEGSRAVLAAVEAYLGADPKFAALDRAAAGAAPEESAQAEIEALKLHPKADFLRAALGAGRELSDRALAVRVLNADAAVRGEPVVWFEIVFVAGGRFESAFARVTRRPGGRPGAPEEHGVAFTVSMSRLGPVRASLDLAGAAATVTLSAATPRARRALDRRRPGLVEALLKLGLRAEVRVTEGPMEAILPSGGGLDVTV